MKTTARVFPQTQHAQAKDGLAARMQKCGSAIAPRDQELGSVRTGFAVSLLAFLPIRSLISFPLLCFGLSEMTY